MCNEVRLTCLHPVRKWVTWGPWKHCCIYLQKSSLSLLWIGYLPWAKIEQGSAHSAQTSKTMPGVHIVPCKGDWSYCSLFYRGQTYLATFSGPPSSFWSWVSWPPSSTPWITGGFSRACLGAPMLGYGSWGSQHGWQVWGPAQHVPPSQRDLNSTGPSGHANAVVWHCRHCWAVTSQGMVPLERLRRFSGKTWGVYVPSSAWE